MLINRIKWGFFESILFYTKTEVNYDTDMPER